MEKGLITNIEKYAVYDGQGIRTVIYLKGCPLTCQWCSNPETQRKRPEIYYEVDDCTFCKKCIEACPHQAIKAKKNGEKVVTDRGICKGCGNCVEACPTGARELVGEELTAQEVFEEAKKDIAFYRQSDGGVTLSGGEVLVQPEFAAAILKKCKREYIHTAVETSGYGNREDLELVLNYTDLVLFDIKHTDSKHHLELTGVKNNLIHENLKLARKMGKEVIIRVPVIPELNDSEENISKTYKLAEEYGIKEVNLLPYHTLGRSKYQKLERDYLLEDLEKLNEEDLKDLANLGKNKDLKIKVGG